MKWFKHLSELSEDAKVMELEQRFGDFGYTVFLKLIEQVAKASPPNTNDPEFGRVIWTVQTLEHKLGGKKFAKLHSVLRFLAHSELMSFKKRGDYVHISFPKMAKIKDNTVKSL